MTTRFAPGARDGYWVRTGGEIVLYPSTVPPDRELDELLPTIPSRKELIDPRIDFHAQEALHRMFNGDPGARADAGGMFAAIKAGRLAGIYIVNQQVPALRARKLDRWWWNLIPQGEDAILLRDSSEPGAGGGAPLIAFRDPVKSVPARLDPALRKAWAAFQLLESGQVLACARPSRAASVLTELSPASCVALGVIIPPPILADPRVTRAPVRVPVPTPAPATPRGLVLVPHFHLQRFCLSGKTFTSAPGFSPMSPSNMNPGFLKSDGLIEFDARLDAKLVDLLVGDREYRRFLAPSSVKASAPGENDRLRVALVDLTGDKKLCRPGYAGWGSTFRMSGASTAKIGIVYAAHQLILDLNVIARAGGIRSRENLVRAARISWSKAAMKCQPDLDWLISVDEKETPVLVRQSEKLEDHLDAMVTQGQVRVDGVPRTSTPIASELILRLGFEYIASVLWQSGLRHPTREGLWIGGTYCPGPIKARANAKCHAGTCPVVWSTNPLPAKTIVLTALSVATFFTLLAQRRLGDATTSIAMERLLKDGCRFEVPEAVTVRAAKCGRVAKSPLLHQALLVEHGSLRYVLVYLTRGPSMSPSLRQRFAEDLDRLVRENNR